MRIVPCEGRKSPAMIFTSVDLPAPLSPISPTTSPGSSVSDTSLTAWMAPKCLETFSSSRIAMPGPAPFDAMAAHCFRRFSAYPNRAFLMNTGPMLTGQRLELTQWRYARDMREWARIELRKGQNWVAVVGKRAAMT